MGHRYHDLVQDDVQTCEACPTQYEGTLRDGRKFYFRYRHGFASLGIAHSIAAAIMSHDAGMETYPNDIADGFLNRSQYEKVFEELYSLQA